MFNKYLNKAVDLFFEREPDKHGGISFEPDKKLEVEMNLKDGFN